MPIFSPTTNPTNTPLPIVNTPSPIATLNTSSPIANTPLPTSNPLTRIPTSNPSEDIPTNTPLSATTYSPSKIPSSSPTISSVSPSGVPSSVPSKCIDDPSLTNEYCPDDPCEKKPYLDFTLSLSVCKKQAFVGNRYGLWNILSNCLCDLSENGKYFDYSNPLSRRRLKRGNNECDLNIIKYGMDRLIRSVDVNINCN
eukprot:444881_1